MAYMPKSLEDFIGWSYSLLQSRGILIKGNLPEHPPVYNGDYLFIYLIYIYIFIYFVRAGVVLLELHAASNHG